MAKFPEPSPLLLDIPRACAQLGLSRASLYRLMQTGRLESVQVGRRRLVPTAALERFVDDLRSDPESPGQREG